MEKEMSEKTLPLRIQQGFESIEESSFVPPGVLAAIDELMAPKTFMELYPKFNFISKTNIMTAEKTADKYQSRYDKYLRALDETPNVFSSSVDFI